MINILVIAGEYPPLKTIGRIRSAKLVQHWHEAGLKPIVLTIDYNKNNISYEESLEKEIPAGVDIYRVANPKREDILIDFVKKIFFRNTKKTTAINPADTKASQSTNTPQKIIKKNISITDKSLNLYKHLFRHWIDIPDDYNSWASDSFDIALDIIDKHNIDIIYVSLPPFSAFKLGYRLKNTTNLPLVVDYRDLWSGDVLREWIHPLRAKYELYLEKKYLSKADTVITVSEQKTEYIRNLSTNNAPCHTITNGFDLDSFDSVLKAAENIHNTETTIVYCGRLFKNRRGYNFLKAFGELKKAESSLVASVRVNFYGGIEKIIYDTYIKIINEYELQENFIFHGDVSFEASKYALATADILLLIVDTGETADGVIPGKLFEYIAVKKPIFALSDSSATNEIIKNSNIGKVVPVENYDLCYAELSNFLKNHNNYKVRNEEYIQTFDRRTLSNRFIEIFKELT